MNSSNRGNVLANADWLIITIFLLLVGFGVANIYAADFDLNSPDFLDLGRRSGKQFMWIGISIVLGFIILLVDSKFIQSVAFPLYGVIMVVQIFVILFAKEVNGARAWLVIGSFKIQPAEFCKFSTALALSVYLSRIKIRMNKDETSIKDVGSFFAKLFSGKKVWSISDISIEQHIIPLGIILLPVLLILLQADTGTAIVFFALFFILFREGIIGNLMYIVLAVISITILTLMLEKETTITILGIVALLVYAAFIKKTQIAALSIGILVLYMILSSVLDLNPAFDTYMVLAWVAYNIIQNYYRSDAWRKIEKFVVLAVLLLSIGYVYSVNQLYDFLQPHQRARIDILLGKVENKTIGFQTAQSMNAIGSGGFLGKGYLQGTLTKGKWVPEQSTDYIFSTVGEEWGFLGSFFVMTLFTVLILRIIYKAEKQRSAASRMYGYGVASILFFHLLVNIGMTIQIMPVIGIPLPFFSYGGSSLLAFTVLLFLFIRFDSQRLDVL